MTLPLDPSRSTPFFRWRKNQLVCENVALEAIAKRTGTPTYVYSGAAVQSAYRNLDRALSRALRPAPHTICYAVKANSNLSLLRLLARLGSGFDIVSGGELERLRRAGVKGKHIVFSGVGKKREEIADALRAGLLLFNVESAAELELLASEAARLRRPAPAALRVNPDVEAGAHPHISTGKHHHKFGIDWQHAWKLYLAHRNSAWIRWQGISAHIGSQILSVAPYREAVGKLAGYVRGLARAGVRLGYVDVGGGFGVRYTSETPPAFDEYASILARELAGLDCHVLVEPGRALVANAGVLLMRVLYVKDTRGKTFVVTDAAMNDFLRPALYDAVHPITNATRTHAKERMRTADAAIVGPVCETGDVFLHSWPMPETKAGDLLLLWGAGAYGFAQSSNYNSRPRPAEVLVEGARFRVIRKRESVADLMRGE
jgi:diaminopimelate decarboxylase